MTEIKLPFDVKTIIQISDIHCRLLKRHDEYKEVFNNLYDEINNIKDNNSIIMITGDVVHSKTDIGPELIELVVSLFKNLSNILPLFIIPGNHDCLLNNFSRMDALYPIINAMNDPNIYYLRESGLYNINGIIFSHMGVLSKESTYIFADKLNSNDINIALYHGVVDGAKLDSGHYLTSNKITMSMFDGFDMVLLGDIHARLDLQKYEIVNSIKKPCMSYPSSLIQQNHGENIEGHGVLIWNIDDRTNKFIPIKNDWGYVTLYISDGKLEPITFEMPKKPRMRLIITNTSPSDVIDIESEIRKLYSPVEIVKKKDKQYQVQHDFTLKSDLLKIRDVGFQNQLIKDYLWRNNSIDDNTLNKIYEINEEMNKKLQQDDVVRNIVWKPKKLTFSNMFSYGENNVINFEKTSGIIGIFSGNATGKSSIFNALAFCMYDKCEKGSKADYILNKRKNSFSCELELEINGENYVIKRYGSRNKSGKIPVKVDFYKVDGDEIISLNGVDRDETNSIIRSFIGSYDDFEITAMSSQNNPSNFIDMGQTERKELLSRFMDITIFDKMHDLASIETKEFQTMLKQYENENYDDQVDEINIKLNKLNGDYSIYDSSKKEKESEKSKLESKILKLIQQMVSIDDNIKDIDTLKSQKKSLENKIEEIKQSISKKNTFLSSVKTQIDLFEKKYMEYKDQETDRKYSEYIKCKEEYNKFNEELEKQKIVFSNKSEKHSMLIKLKYNSDCNHCIENKSILEPEAMQLENEMKKDFTYIQQLFSDVDNMKNEVHSYGDIEDKMANMAVLNKDISTLKTKSLEISNLKNQEESKINLMQIDITNIENSMQKYYQYKDDIEKNKEIEKQISILKSEVLTYDTSIRKLDTKLRDIHALIKVQEDRRSILLEKIQRFDEMSEKFNAYQLYMSAINRNGIPYELISKIMPTIETEANNILSQVVDFNIMLELDGKNINCQIVYDDNKVWPLEITSGMERFISGLIAIRIALNSITNLPKPNFIAIDEGFSALDSDNGSNLPSVFDYLRNTFDFVFIVSHLDYIRDFVDRTMELKKENDFSKITYN